MHGDGDPGGAQAAASPGEQAGEQAREQGKDPADTDLLSVIEDEDSPQHGSGAREPQGRRAKVAIIDDDEAVHEGTRFALKGYSLNGSGLEILSAYSAAQARDLLAAHPDTAVILLDVVMETDTAGLDLVGFIRDDLANDTVRIILRTGQPGQAPEREVIVRYDINDYKSKTELTADKLFTTLTAALRSYDQLHRISETNRKLGAIAESTSRLLKMRSLQSLAEGMLDRLGLFLGLQGAGAVILAGLAGEDPAVLAARGRHADLVRRAASGGLPPDLQAATMAASAATQPVTSTAGHLSVRLPTESGRSVIIALEGAASAADDDRILLEVFADRLAAAFDNALLHGELREANSFLEQRVAQRTNELLAANRRLEAQWARARRTTAFQNEVLGIVAHDLKNPLSVIMGRTEILSEVLKEQDALSDAARNQIERIRDSAKLLTGMVDSLIKDAMADASDIPVHRESADLGALVSEAVEANRPLAERKEQALTFTGADGVRIACDPERMREAVDNLVGNAVKYTPAGGRIAVTLERSASEARIRVSDNGPGLLPEDFPRLFGRFQRLSARPTGGENSTGLGLFIAKRIVELHDGRIEVHSPGPNQGAQFEIVLDIAASAEAAA
jgi:signal transduction histidine kinase